MGNKDRQADDRHDRQHDKDHRDKHSREEFEFSTTTRATQVAEYLNRIADGLRQGTLTLAASGHAVHLQPGDAVRLEVEAESRPDKGTASLQLDLSWKLASPAREPREEALTIETEARDSQPAGHAPTIQNA
jgi:amphi-Trp domain-containing protein